MERPTIPTGEWDENRRERGEKKVNGDASLFAQRLNSISNCKYVIREHDGTRLEETTSLRDSRTWKIIFQKEFSIDPRCSRYWFYKIGYCFVSRTVTHHHPCLTTTLASLTSHTHALTYTPRKKTVDSVWKIRDSQSKKGINRNNVTRLMYKYNTK